MIKLNINGKAYQVDVGPEVPLLWVIRNTSSSRAPSSAAASACAAPVRSISTGRRRGPADSGGNRAGKK